MRHANFLSKVSPKTFSAREPTLLPTAVPLQKTSENNSYVLLNIGSNEPGRRWPIDHYFSIATHIVNHGFHVFFIGTDGNNIIQDKINSHNMGDKISSLIGKTNLDTLLRVMKRAKLVVSNDSGPAHLSIGLGVSTIVIVGGGHYGCFFPYPAELTPKNVKFISKSLDCYHCFWRCDKRTLPSDAFPCVGEVSIVQVRKVCDELLLN